MEHKLQGILVQVGSPGVHGLNGYIMLPHPSLALLVVGNQKAKVE